MKNCIISLMSIIVLVSCKKDISPSILSEAQNEDKQKVEACFSDKQFPISDVGESYVEGEIDGKKFRITAFKDGFEYLENLNRFFEKYDTIHLDREKRGVSWQGLPYIFNYTEEDQTNKNLDFEVIFPSFRGDSVKYAKFISQFDEKNKYFPIGDRATPKEYLEKIETNFDIALALKGCIIGDNSQTYRVTSNGNQKDGYLRLADIKYYKRSDNKIYRRDLTFEFEVNLYSNALAAPFKRIKKGKMVLVI
jgi:hypothetical protein